MWGFTCLVRPFYDRLDIQVPYLFYRVPDDAPVGPDTIYTDRWWDWKDGFSNDGPGLVDGSLKPYFGPLPAQDVTPLTGNLTWWATGLSYTKYLAGEYPKGKCCVIPPKPTPVRVGQLQDVIYVPTQFERVDQRQGVSVPMPGHYTVDQVEGVMVVFPITLFVDQVEDVLLGGSAAVEQVEDVVLGGPAAVDQVQGVQVIGPQVVGQLEDVVLGAAASVGQLESITAAGPRVVTVDQKQDVQRRFPTPWLNCTTWPGGLANSYYALGSGFGGALSLFNATFQLFHLFGTAAPCNYFNQFFIPRVELFLAASPVQLNFHDTSNEAFYTLAAASFDPGGSNVFTFDHQVGSGTAPASVVLNAGP